MGVLIVFKTDQVGMELFGIGFASLSSTLMKHVLRHQCYYKSQVAPLSNDDD